VDWTRTGTDIVLGRNTIGEQIRGDPMRAFRLLASKNPRARHINSNIVEDECSKWILRAIGEFPIKRG
jgi:hypothetical protein